MYSYVSCVNYFLKCSVRMHKEKSCVDSSNTSLFYHPRNSYCGYCTNNITVVDVFLKKKNTGIKFMICLKLSFRLRNTVFVVVVILVDFLSWFLNFSWPFLIFKSHGRAESGSELANCSFRIQN